MPSSEECFAAQADVKERCIQRFQDEGHPRRSAEEIVRHMSYREQAEKIGQKVGEPYSPY